MNCETVRKNISLFLYGELPLEEEQSLQDHLDTCEECRAALEAEKRLQALLDTRDPEPDGALLARCRRDLASSLESSAPQRVRLRKWFARLADLRVGSLARPVGALALVALGFFAARWTAPVSVPSAANGAEAPVTRIRYLNPEPSGKVQILLEETRQRTISGSPEDNRIRPLLLEAARESADPGVRAESMGLLTVRQPSADLRPVLLYAVQHDPNPGVRLKALDALKTDAGDRDVRDVLARILLTDKNPGVRAEAIDLLVQHKEQSTVGVLQELVQKENNSYVRLRCQRALEDMNASVGTF